MKTKQDVQLRLISNVVIGYLLMALVWWSILLYNQNKDSFAAKVHYLKIIKVAEGSIVSEADFEQTAEYQSLVKKYTRQEWMILGEGTVFILSMFIGIYLINRGYQKQMESARNQRNFLLSITHELKSPIASIRLVLETFNRRQLDRDKQTELTMGALAETERLTNLVEDLLLSARLESSYQPHFEKLNLLALLEDLIERLEVKYPEVEFGVSLPETLVAVEGDKTGLTSVFINLLENAVKYSPVPAKINLAVTQQSDAIQITIADRGIGITDIEKKKVFNKFYRVGSEDTRRTKGTGLGLYIVKSIITAHNGAITLTNNVPSGSVFTVNLPLPTLQTQTKQPEQIIV